MLGLNFKKSIKDPQFFEKHGSYHVFYYDFVIMPNNYLRNWWVFVLFDIGTNASVMMQHSWLWSLTLQFLKYVDIFTCPQITLYHLV